jgi:hypothetical protein
MATTAPTRQKIRIADLDVSDELMPRDSTDWDTSVAYRDAYDAGVSLPPITVFADDERPGRYWLADGWHRLDAQRTFRAEGEAWDPGDDGDLIAYAKDAAEVDAEVHPGGKVAAMLYAAGANITHGRRRTREDAIAAAKVAIRALSLQNPDQRPTWEAVKATAHVGTETVQRAFRALEEDQEREQARAQRTDWLAAKDPRGGARDHFAPQGANPSAYPDLDENGKLPVVTIGGGPLRTAEQARETPVTVVVTRHTEPPPPPMLVRVTTLDARALETQRRARELTLPIERLRESMARVQRIAPDEARRAWSAVSHDHDLAAVLREVATAAQDYADAVEAAADTAPRPIHLVQQGADGGA